MFYPRGVISVQLSSVQSLSHVWLFAASWTAEYQAFLSFTISWSLLKLMSIESVMPSNHLILCCLLLLLPSIIPRIRVFSNELALRIRWPKYLLELQLQHPSKLPWFSSVQFSLVTQLCPTLWDPREYSRPGLPEHHQLLEFTQTHLHWVSDAIQPSHLLSSPSPPAFNLSQHHGLFHWVCSLH